VKVGARIFIGTGVFGIVVGAIYWYVSSEAAGTTLLLAMGIAPLILAGYVLRRREREVPPEDRPDARPEDAAGEVVGSFPAESAWPIALAGSSVLVLGGLVYGPALLVLGCIGFAVCIVGLMRESRS
jgi:cytochrome c oxidase subunit IV